jgi:ATP-dependent DNA helicase RecG
MTNPEVEEVNSESLHTNRILPYYPSTAPFTQRMWRTMQHPLVTHWAPRVADPLPEAIRAEAGLIDLPTALQQIHFPDRMENAETALRRLAFDEIFLLQLGVQSQKQDWQEQEARRFEIVPHLLETQIARLPYLLTAAQRRALNDIQHDLASGRPMNRLLQGDVGSGKTIVAALSIWMVVQSGAQAAIMAPTSILAEQHYKTMLATLSGEGAPLAGGQIRLLIGATPMAEKEAIRQGLENGEVKLVIGTHALLEEPVGFQDLQLVVIDEQHRFGVEQRGSLRAKGANPHLLVMTATPIPRSLALTVYGDLDLTVMDEMPPGRQEIATYVLYPREVERAYTLIRKQLELGRQAFVIYPLVEESENSEAKAAVEEHTRLKTVFPNQSLGLLHGRMKAEDKESEMALFRDGGYQILVSTSVVEVGVDVPNATVMLIEGANHFGLSQLHQFRGRVGRGEHKSYCLLIPEHEDAVENERLQAMVETNDGFVLAERDLVQRGPGEFLGTRQSGFLGLKHAKLTDLHLVETARRLAINLFIQDPHLAAPEHQLLAQAVKQAWGQMKGDVS